MPRTSLCLGRHLSGRGRKWIAALVGSWRRYAGSSRTSGTRSKILISIKLASREFGVLSVESNHENAFGAEDRVLLEGVALRWLASFPAGENILPAGLAL